MCPKACIVEEMHSMYFETSKVINIAISDYGHCYGHYFLFAYPQIEDLLEAGGAIKDVYMTDNITHVIAEEDDDDEVMEARDLFLLSVVQV